MAVASLVRDLHPIQNTSVWWFTVNNNSLNSTVAAEQNEIHTLTATPVNIKINSRFSTVYYDSRTKPIPHSSTILPNSY